MRKRTWKLKSVNMATAATVQKSDMVAKGDQEPRRRSNSCCQHVSGCWGLVACARADHLKERLGQGTSGFGQTL